MKSKSSFREALTYIFLFILALAFLAPIAIIIMNSVKGNFYISQSPFSLPNYETFVGAENFIKGFKQSDFMKSFFNSAFITFFSVAGIVLMTSMTAWFIVRVKNKLTKLLYYLFVFSMIVPFQMVMYTMTYYAFELNLNNRIGIIFIYLGFGAGLSVFMFSGFIKSIPTEIEEAATIDGCSPVKTFFLIVFPILKPTAITVAILNAMWIWNDYLLPYLVLGSGEGKTLPVAVQMALTGGYGNKDMGALMAMLVLAILPIIIFYLFCQKYIIRGVAAGAVKG
ncbi:MAG: carbohydrate ABC transporter permease [Oscillospiraceae bacterium]|nr:carbohydrate ABC transporter permease [Clostridiaceae bacterium]MDY5949359.1 carbohydrate ABC transporter permease [Oscillospiraceae bacterium]